MMKKILMALVLYLTASSVLAEDYFEAGKKEFYSQNYVKAELYFKKALEQNPENYPCHYYLAHTYAHNDEIFKAKEEYSKVITFAPNKTLQKLAMQSMYNINKMEKISNKAVVTSNGDNYLEYVKLNEDFVKWKSFPIRVYVKPSEDSVLIKRAFMNWQKVTDNKVSFVFEQSLEKAQIVASTMDEMNIYENSTFQGGVAEVKVKNGYIYKSNIDVLKINPLNKEKLSSDVIYTSALHEIGHSLGLQGHSPDKNDVMVAKDSPRAKNLSQRDINTLMMLYAKWKK